MKKSIVAASIALALGVSTSASAGLLANSTTYTVSVDSGCFAFAIDCSTAAQNVPGGSFTITTDASGDGFSLGNYSMSAYTGTPGGLFSTGGPVAGAGSVDAVGNISLDFAGRTGSAQLFPFLGTPAWNIDPDTGLAAVFTSGSDSVLVASNLLTISGSALNAIGANTFTGEIVSAAQISALWGPFVNTPYTEIYQITVTGASAVPVPAAAWLFGTGLIGLVGVARRRKSA